MEGGNGSEPAGGSGAESDREPSRTQGAQERGPGNDPGGMRVLPADPQPIVLEGLRSALSAEPGIRVLAGAASAEEALERVRMQRPDILVLEPRMPEGDALGRLAEPGLAGAATRVVLFTAEMDEEQVLEAWRLGVQGIVLKSMSTSSIVSCLRKVHAGGQWYETGSVARAVQRLLKSESIDRLLAVRLSTREQEVVRLVAAGLRNREVAQQLQMSEGTVKTHLHHIYEKLEVTSRVQLVAYLGAGVSGRR
jgi:two-component system, NarL family, nitrate/nitrite response regulator NarL